MAEERTQNRIPAWLIPAVFLSGAAGLVYETLWIRLLSLSLGSTAQALCLVLSVFMLGLGLGAWAFGRLADRSEDPLRLYAVLELALGAFCALTPWLFRAAGPFSAAALLLSPAMLMGATLPVLTRYLAGRGLKQGQAVSRLYFWNTLGAAAGALTAAFVLLRAFGVSASLWLAAALSAAVGLFVLAASRGALPASQEPDWRPAEDFRTEPAGDRAAFRVLFALSGALAMGFQVVWTRLLTLVLGSTVFSLALVLGAQLAGLALGGLLAGLLLERRPPRAGTLGLILAGIGAASLGLLALYAWAPFAYLKLFALSGQTPLFQVLLFACAFAALLGPSILMGMTLPWFADLCESGRRQGGRVGSVLLANTLGSALGPWAAAFLLIPGLGLQAAAGALALGSAGLGCAAMLVEGRSWRRWAGWTAAAAAAGWLLLPRIGMDLLHSGAALGARVYLRAGADLAAWRGVLSQRKELFAKDGVTASVSAWEHPSGVRSLVLDGKPDATDAPVDLATQYLLGHLPVLAARRNADPALTSERALVIGFGIGTTLAALARHPVKEIELVEIEPRVLEAAPLFERVNRGVLKDPRVKVHIDDGRHHLEGSDKRYDAIVSDPSYPWIAGMTHLYSLEFFSAAREHLTQGGVFCQWLPIYGLSPEAFRSVLETFRRSFPYASVWLRGGDALLLGSLKPQGFDWEGLQAHLESSGAKDDLQGWMLGDAPGLLAHWVSDEEGLAGLAAEGSAPAAHSDDRPVLEYLSRMSQQGLERRNTALLERFARPVGGHLRGGESERRWLVRSLLVLERPEAAAREFRTLPKDDPWYAGLERDLGETFLKRGRAVRALEVFEARLRERPRDPAAHLDLARARMAQGDQDGALKALEGFSRRVFVGRADQAAARARREGRPALVYLAMGFGYAGLNEGRQAAELFARVLKTEPGLLDETTRDEKGLVR
ncbi:MAG TPA: hypothetical protein DCM05_16560 [Elusimicrobia bacterium]|nr:hypothetical protein [Elusimicrobiota bacterium]